MKTLKVALRRWFDGHSPRQDSFELGLSTIYVFFSPQGYLYLALLAITFALGTNYGNNLVLGVFFYLMAVWLIASIATFLQLYELRFEIKSISLSHAHSIAWVELSVGSHAKPSRQIALSFDIDKDKLEALSAADRQYITEHAELVLTSTDSSASIRLPVVTGKRGVMSLPRLRIHSVYPLGITRAWSYGFFERQAFVYPMPRPFEGTSTSIAQISDLGSGGQLMVGTDDFDKLDTYVEGENLARVSWSHVARGMGMLTKHFGDGVLPNETLDYYVMPSMHHEERLEQLAYLLTKQDPNSPFFLNLPSGKSPLGMGQTFIDECLIRLAKEP